MPSRRRPTKEQLATTRAQGRVRAARWRERHTARVYGLEAAAAVAAVDAAIVDALIVTHMARRDATGDRDAPISLRDVVRAARELLAGDGTLPELDAHAAIRERLRAGAMSLPGEAGHVPTPGLSAAA